MRFQVSHASTLIAGCLFYMACSTVPDNAPQEYHLADAAIERAEDSYADDHFPQTLERAKISFDEALELYDQSRDNDSADTTRQAIGKAGAEKAAKAQQLADEATNLHAQVLAWDAKIEGKQETEKMTADLATAQTRTAMLEEQTKNLQAQQAKPQTPAGIQANIKTPLVFFPTAKSMVSDRFNENVMSLATTLKSNPQLKVTLIGYADKTGRTTANNELAQKRAESVANMLRMQGVNADQVLIDSQGSSQSTASSVAGLQLDRRVDALITTTPGAAETMTTGR